MLNLCIFVGWSHSQKSQSPTNSTGVMMMLSFALVVILLIGVCFVVAGNKALQETKNEPKQQAQK